VDAPAQTKTAYEIAAPDLPPAPERPKPVRVKPTRKPAEPDFDAMRLAAQIRRVEMGMTLKQMVARADASESAITGALYGYHDGSVRTWFAIAHALDMAVDELMATLERPMARVAA